MLEVLGLAADEEDLYEWLLERSPVPSGDLVALVASRPWAARLPDLLVRLEELGLVVRLPGAPPSWQTVPPDIAFAALAQRGERALTLARRRRAELSAAFRHAARHEDPVQLVEVVRGRPAIGERYVQMQRAARYEVRCFDAPPYVARAPQVNTLELELLRRGVRYRVLYDRHGLELPGRLTDLEAGLAHGEQARVTDVPIKLVLSDCPMALLPLQHEPTDIETSLVVHDSVLLDALSALFEMYWDRAIPLQVHNGHAQLPDAGDAPTDLDRDLLPLLAAGFTDQAIATQLGCNERTVRRYLKDMMHRLDAVTRFQAGYQAIRRGWLTTDRTASA